MTPRRFSPDVVQAKLEAIDVVVGHLAAVGEVTLERLQSDAIVRAAVERFLTQLVDLAVAANAHIAASLLEDPPPDASASFAHAARAGAIGEDLALALAPSTGLRNVLVHDYTAVDHARVAAAVPLALEHYGRYVREVAQFLETR
jgi:uncharacterized protein YutE (UPF0331/DUF86 family)